MNSIRAREKWQKRGWQMVKESTSTRRLDLRTVNRFVGDRYCWRFPCERRLTLSDISASESNQTVDVLSGHSWQLLYPHDNDKGFYAIYAWLQKFAKYVQRVLSEARGSSGIDSFFASSLELFSYGSTAGR